MDEEAIIDDTILEEASADDLDDFDLSTPAEAEARRQAASEQEEEIEEPVVEEKSEAETPEKPAYVAPQRIQMEVPKFEGEIPVDEYGNIDPKGLAEYMQKFSEYAMAAAEAKANNAYYENVHGQREWSDVGEAYPELVKNESTRSLIENLRVADAIRGGKGDLMAAAAQIAELQTAKYEEGRQSTQSNITRQKSVQLKGSTRSQTPRANDIASLRKKAFSSSPDSESARLSLLSNLYDSGALSN